MAIKTHITKQDESIAESGIQIRNADPSTPVENQVWINTAENRLKVFKDAKVHILSEGVQPSATVAGGIIDVSRTSTHEMIVYNDFSVNVQNSYSGARFTLLVTNTKDSAITMNLGNSNYLQEGDDWSIPSMSKKMFEFLQIKGDLLVKTYQF